MVTSQLVTKGLRFLRTVSALLAHATYMSDLEEDLPILWSFASVGKFSTITINECL